MELNITKIGNSSGIILNKEVMAKLRAHNGDKVYMTETSSGYEISPYDPEFASQMELAELVMHENKDVLKKLAE